MKLIQSASQGLKYVWVTVINYDDSADIFR
jgi:hypothetical protein